MVADSSSRPRYVYSALTKYVNYVDFQKQHLIHLTKEGRVQLDPNLKSKWEVTSMSYYIFRKQPKKNCQGYEDHYLATFCRER